MERLLCPMTKSALDERDDVATVTMNRPPANAIDLSFLAKELWIAPWIALVTRSTIRAMILTGHGFVFSAGLDLKESPLP